MELITPPQAILFDWDNTLVDTWPVIHKALEVCFIHMERTPWTMEEVQANVQHSAKDAFTLIFADRCDEAIAVYQQAYRDHKDGQIAFLKGATKVLDAVKTAGLYSAVVSNKRGNTLREEVAQLQADHYFSAIIGAGDAQNDKPHPDHAEMALEACAALPTNRQAIWFIGDSAVDIEIAKNCGFTAILYGTKQKAATINFPIAAQVENQQQLLDLIASS